MVFQNKLNANILDTVAKFLVFEEKSKQKFSKMATFVVLRLEGESMDRTNLVSCNFSLTYWR